MTLLALYQQSKVLQSKLSLSDQKNIIGIVADPRFKSIIKLFENEQSSFLSQSLFSNRSPEEMAVMKGASLAITALLSSINTTIVSNYQTQKDNESKAETLESLGW